jgi:two-component system sensor histidine kinase UhpB
MSRLGWQARLMVLIPLILGAMLLFQLLYVLPHVRDRAAQQEQARQEEIVRNIAWTLDSELLLSRERLMEIATRAEFTGMDIASQQSTLETIAEGSIRFVCLAAIDAEGWIVSSAGPEDLSMLTTRSYVDEPYFYVPFEQGEIYCREPQSYPSEQLLCVAVCVPIESTAWERAGILMGTLRLNHLAEMVAGYPLEEGMVASVVAREGRVAAGHPLEEGMVASVTDGEGRVVARSGIDMFSLEEGPLSLDGSDYPLGPAMAGETGVFSEYVHDGVPCYGACAPLKSIGWGVIVERPKSLVLAEAAALSNQLLPLNGVLFAIILIGAILLVRQVITTQARMECAMSDSEEKFRSLFEQSTEVVYVCTPEGDAIDANPAWLNLFGYSREELKGFKTIDLYADPKDRDDFLRRIAETGFVEDEVRFKKKDGSAMVCVRTAVARKDQSGNIVAYQSTAHDITERKRMEEQLAEANRELRELTVRLEAAREEERAEVAWDLHDHIAQALSVLKLEVDSCRGKLAGVALTSLAPTMDGMTQVLDETIGRLRRLYADLVPVMLEDLGLAATIEWQTEEFTRVSGVECELRRVEDIKLPRGRVALGLFRVLQEALDNVRRHSGATKVTVDFEREGGDAVLRVADNGRGFAEDEARKPGAIGLTGIRERVQSWGGRVTIDSSVGAGTVLEATAPLEDEPAGKTAPESSPI